MDLEKDIVPKVSFNPEFQPFGHEQRKFINLVEAVVDTEAVSSRTTDLQKEMLQLRFLEDKSYKEIAGEMNLDVEEVEKTRNRSVKNLYYIFDVCKIDIPNMFDLKLEELKAQLTKGHEEIFKRFENFIDLGLITKDDFKIAKSYSQIFNGLGNDDPNINFFGGGLSDNGDMIKNEKGNISKTMEKLRRIERLFYSKHFK
jgi:predicted DNA-binding protein YlxM (UPF0122 family)